MDMNASLDSEVYPGQLFDPDLKIELYVVKDGTSGLLADDHATVKLKYVLKKDSDVVDQGKKVIELYGGESKKLLKVVEFEYNPNDSMTGNLELNVNLESILIYTKDSNGNATEVSLDVNASHLTINNDDVDVKNSYEIKQPKLLVLYKGEPINDKTVQLNPEKITLESTLEGYNPNMNKYVSVDARMYSDFMEGLISPNSITNIDFSDAYGAYKIVTKTTMNGNDLTSVVTMLVKLPQYCDGIVDKKRCWFG